MSSSPHIRSKVTTSNIMLMVDIALLPASAFGVYNFGCGTLMLSYDSNSCSLTEYIMKN